MTIRTLLIALSFITLLTPGASAQGKIGYVNSQELLLSLTERGHVQAKIEQFGTALQQQFQMMTNEYQTKISEYQNLPADTPAAVRSARENELVQLEQRISDFQKSSEQAILEHEQELLQPLIEKVQTAINTLAKQEKYVHVFDTGSALVYPEENDFTELVKKELMQ